MTIKVEVLGAFGPGDTPVYSGTADSFSQDDDDNLVMRRGNETVIIHNNAWDLVRLVETEEEE